MVKDKTLICLIGASGSGKTTIGKDILRNWFHMNELVSVTTREKRDGEKNKIDYYFISEDEYNDSDLIESVTYSGNKYGLTKKEVADKIINSHSNWCYVVVDYEGYKHLRDCLYIKNNDIDVISIGIDIDEDTCKTRMIKRGDSVSSIGKRIYNSRVNDEYNIHKLCDYSLDGKESLKNGATSIYGQMIKIKDDIIRKKVDLVLEELQKEDKKNED